VPYSLPDRFLAGYQSTSHFGFVFAYVPPFWAWKKVKDREDLSPGNMQKRWLTEGPIICIQVEVRNEMVPRPEKDNANQHISSAGGVSLPSETWNPEDTIPSPANTQGKVQQDVAPAHPVAAREYPQCSDARARRSEGTAGAGTDWKMRPADLPHSCGRQWYCNVPEDDDEVLIARNVMPVVISWDGSFLFMSAKKGKMKEGRSFTGSFYTSLSLAFIWSSNYEYHKEWLTGTKTTDDNLLMMTYNNTLHTTPTRATTETTIWGPISGATHWRRGRTYWSREGPTPPIPGATHRHRGDSANLSIVFFFAPSFIPYRNWAQNQHWHENTQKKRVIFT
jgi:hypothetical protein